MTLTKATVFHLPKNLPPQSLAWPYERSATSVSASLHNNSIGQEPTQLKQQTYIHPGICFKVFNTWVRTTNRD